MLSSFTQWLIGFVPSWILHVAVVASVLGITASYLLKIIPWVRLYCIPLRIISIVLLLVFVWLEGSRANNDAWEKKVAEAEAKVKIAEEKSQQANEDLQNALKQKTKKIKEERVIIKEKIKRIETKINADCRVDPEAIAILNEAAGNKKGNKK
jgi:apolipoprotein N-acyltransferase